MTLAEIEILVNGLILAAQLIITQINDNTHLTDEQKKGYLDRITSIQDRVKGSKFPV